MSSAGQGSISFSRKQDAAAGSFTISVGTTTTNLAGSTTLFFGANIRIPSTVINRHEITILKACTLTGILIDGISNIAGSAEAWPMIIRVNNTTDFPVSTISVSSTNRVWSNTTLNIALIAGDKITIKTTTPAWAANPTTTNFSAYIICQS